ncbi:MAG: hypothetical protein K940chlam2_00716 [Chlamydiae bacterium]|nr:hypothetical protein [Chlamydiota bacterium]
MDNLNSITRVPTFDKVQEYREKQEGKLSDNVTLTEKRGETASNSLLVNKSAAEAFQQIANRKIFQTPFKGLEINGVQTGYLNGLQKMANFGVGLLNLNKQVATRILTLADTAATKVYDKIDSGSPKSRLLAMIAAAITKIAVTLFLGSVQVLANVIASPVVVVGGILYGVAQLAKEALGIPTLEKALVSQGVLIQQLQSGSSMLGYQAYDDSEDENRFDESRVSANAFRQLSFSSDANDTVLNAKTVQTDIPTNIYVSDESDDEGALSNVFGDDLANLDTTSVLPSMNVNG